MPKVSKKSSASVPNKIARLTKRVEHGWQCEAVESCGHVQEGDTLNAYNFARHVKRKHPAVYIEYGLGTIDQEPDSNPRSEPSVRINMAKQTFLGSIVKLVTKHKLPYHALTWEGMQQLIEPLESGFKCKVNSSNVPSLVKNTADGIKQLIIDEVKNKMVSIQFDTTTKYGRCIIGVTVLFFKDSNIVKRTLGNLFHYTANRSTKVNNFNHTVHWRHSVHLSGFVVT